ncbi:MAG: LVIVD repeat-containing protein [Thermoleophilaceae bacterium]
MWHALALLIAAALALPASAAAQGPFGPLNDLFALGEAGGQTPDTAPMQHNPEPPLTATPRAHCLPGSKPEPGIQGRVPAGSADKGLWCNMKLIGHEGTEGGFKVFRYVDTAGHECAFYDTTLMFPLNAFNPGAGSEGVAVLDMSNPAHPVRTDTLTTPPMLSPHESLNLNTKRGLLAAVNGNLSTEPGLFAIYDVHADCRHPVLDALTPVARFGHESGFAPDGNTFYATGTAVKAVTAIDVTDPTAPHAIWQGNLLVHGMTVSDDGNRAYLADPTGGDMVVLDTSQIQARKPDAQAREISRLTWKSASIPQNAIPFTSHGKPYVLEFDEYTQGTLKPDGDPDAVGAGRIIDVSDERAPRVVSNLRLQVDQPDDHKAASGDPGAQNRAQGYAAHYCNIPTRVDPRIVACSFIASGLRLFDITDVTAPKEVGYFVAPPQPRSENGYMASDFAMSQPAFVPERHEIWYSDGTTGFYVLHVDDSVWPKDAGAARGACPSRFVVKVRIPARAKVRRVRATLAGRRLRVVKRGRGYYAHVTLARPQQTVRLVARIRLRSGRTVTTTRVYHPCGQSKTPSS